ncbi:MAG: HPr family phosphocarrier protein [Euryarchaeota archaeon]|nr:HPr family phosphocarrier protein [Euryarchaeota archaeon]
MESKRDIIIENKLGLHARPAAQLVQVASKFDSEITFRRGEDEVNGKSIMGVLMLAAPLGSTIQVNARGEDAAAAVQAVEDLVAGKFGEE